MLLLFEFGLVAKPPAETSLSLSNLLIETIRHSLNCVSLNDARALILMWGPATRKISTPSAHARQHNKEPGLTSARPRRRTSSASSPLILFRSYDKLVLFRQFA
jgi:hypothetical protein